MAMTSPRPSGFARARLPAGSPGSASPAALDIFDMPDPLLIIRTNKIWSRGRIRCAERGHHRRTDPRGPALHSLRPSWHRPACPRDEHSTADPGLVGGVGATADFGHVF